MVAQIKRVDRSATLSFCPSGPFLAAGSVAGAIDLSFSSATQLEIFRLDFASTDQELRLAGGAVQAPERFSRLCWGPPGVDTKSYPYGLIAGGLCDGSVCLWNPARIIGHKADAAGSASPASTRGQLLARLQKHQGPVKGLEFNGFSPNLLASGGADGELCIWDLGNPLQPSLYPAMKGGSGGPQPEITHLTWNRKVQHILATCTAAGTVVVWDLKKQRPVISFKDPSGRKRCSALQWNPEVATQLIVASDDDMAPSLQLWDLRNSVSPVKEFHGHAKGVLAMSWCPQDSSFILSSGKDNRTICWDVNAGETYCELPPAANWNFDVQWAPGPLAGVFATATFEGQVGISSLSSCTAVGGEADGFSFGQAGVPVASKSKAPAWLKRPVGATLGFGGKLVQLTNSKRQLPTGETATSGSITISQVMTEPEMVQRSEAFEAAIRGGDRDALNAFCQDRESQLAGSEEAETWAFLQTHFAPDGRKYLLERLGFAEYLAAQQQQAEAGADGGADGGAALEQEGQHTAGDVADGMQQLTLEQQQQQQQQQAAAAAAHLLGADDGADFFEQSPVNDQAFFDQLVGTPPRNTAAVSPTHRSAPVSPKPPTERGVIDGPPGEREVDIQRLLFVGNYQGAVEACLEAERHADALVVASVVGGDLWDTARKAYMLAHPRPYMRMLHSVLSGDWAAFINARHPSAWRETLAAILTSAPYEQFESLLAALAAALAQAGMAHAATLCFICAGDVDPAVRQWTKAVSKGGQAPTVEALEALMEKAVVLGLGVNRQGASEALSDLIVRYAELLASNGRLGTALEYLSMIPGEPTTGIAVLKERIYRSAAGSSQLPPTVVPPPFPFSAEEVTVSAYQQQGSTGYAQQGGYNMQAQQQQQPASSYQSYGGGYGAAPAQQQNGYGAGTPTGYSSTPAAAPAPPPPQVQQYSPMQQYQAPQAQQYQAPPAQQYQPPQAQYQAPQAQQYQAPPQQQQYQSYGSAGGYAAPPSPAGTPTGQQQQQQQYQAAVYQPSAAASAPQVFQPSASGPGMGMQGPPPSAAPPPAQVFQPVAAPAAVYQHAPMAASAGGPPATLHQSTSGAMAATAFVPQQGPAAMVPGPRTGPTPTPITAPPPPPPGPPANISLANADTSMVPAHLQPVVASLSNLYRMCEMSAGGHPGKKREVEDSSRKLGVLFWRMGRGEVSDSVAGKLLQLCQALDGGDFVTATHLQVSLTTSDWDECAAWLTALKRLIKARQMVG